MKSISEDVRFYCEQLIPLWESYIKFITLAIMLSGGSLLFLINIFLFNKDFKGEKDISEIPLLGYAAVLYATATGCFLACRWLSQILMERQAYGPAENALAYFKITETKLPTALLTWGRSNRPLVLGLMYYANETAKWFGIMFLNLGWFFVAKFSFANSMLRGFEFNWSQLYEYIPFSGFFLILGVIIGPVLCGYFFYWRFFLSHRLKE